VNQWRAVPSAKPQSIVLVAHLAVGADLHFRDSKGGMYAPKRVSFK
jgi:hypothetical protein